MCESAFKTQVGGEHYRHYKIQPLEFLVANQVPFAEGCVIKRLLRHRQKDGRQDLEKAIHEIQAIIEVEYGGGEG